MPTLFRFLTVVAVIGGLIYGGVFMLATLCRSETARNHRDNSARQVSEKMRCADKSPQGVGIGGIRPWSRCSSTCLPPNRGPAAIPCPPTAAIWKIFRTISREGRSFKTAVTEHLRGYLADLDGRGFKPSSVARRLSTMRHLFRFLLNEGQRGDDPAAILAGPKRGRPLPKVLSIKDVDRLLAAAAAEAAASGRSPAQRVRAARLACLLEILYATGLRVSELVSLPMSAARRDARMLIVRGKGDKERMVPLNDAARRRTTSAYLAAVEAARDQDLMPGEPRPNGCFPPSAKAGISPGNILRAT